jgi:chromosome segregation ATPase
MYKCTGVVNMSPSRRYAVREAAEHLGISVDGVRQRIRRGQLESEKDADGRVYVWLDIDENMSVDNSIQSVLESKDETIQHLSEQLSFLRSELERKDHLLAQMNANISALTERIPAIEPPAEESPDAPESPVTASEEESKGDVPPEPETAESEPWWRRIFR